MGIEFHGVLVATKIAKIKVDKTWVILFNTFLTLYVFNSAVRVLYLEKMKRRSIFCDIYHSLALVKSSTPIKSTLCNSFLFNNSNIIINNYHSLFITGHQSYIPIQQEYNRSTTPSIS